MYKGIISTTLATLFMFTFSACAQKNIYLKNFNVEKGLAIKGYDPVSYFVQQKAIKGNKAIAEVVNGVTYNFYSEENKNLFKANPSKYEPQYGGWCAYAIGATGSKVEIDPETFKIIDGKLYLFYNAKKTNTLILWNKEEATLKPKADIFWAKIFN